VFDAEVSKTGAFDGAGFSKAGVFDAEVSKAGAFDRAGFDGGVFDGAKGSCDARDSVMREVFRGGG